MSYLNFLANFNIQEYNPLQPWVLPLDSTCLESVEYDPIQLNLICNFTDGTTYSYMFVSYDDFYGLVNAPSVGRYFNMYIRDQHAFVEG